MVLTLECRFCRKAILGSGTLKDCAAGLKRHEVLLPQSRTRSSDVGLHWTRFAQPMRKGSSGRLPQINTLYPFLCRGFDLCITRIQPTTSLSPFSPSLPFPLQRLLCPCDPYRGQRYIGCLCAAINQAKHSSGLAKILCRLQRKGQGPLSET